jgi:integrase/recombinase XerC
MAHYPKPFFRPSRNLWYVQLDGKQIKLAADKDAAFTEYHRLMQHRAETPQPKPGQQLVVTLLDEFLDWCEKHRAPDTYRWYKDRLESFCKTIEPALASDEMKPHHVQKWVDNYPVTLADGSRRNLIAAVKRGMKWAEEQGYIDRSPIAHMKKPACGRKEQVITAAQYQAMLDRTKDEDFKNLLTVTWETGCRPQESLRVEARHVDLAGSRWVFPASEAKGKRIPRIIYLTPKAVEITKRLMERHPTGPLFRNRDGEPWTPDAVNCRFQRAKEKVGTKISLYACRHTFATRALMRGVDCITVATLMGHSDTSTLAKVYQHVSQNPEFLKGQLLKAAG